MNLRNEWFHEELQKNEESFAHRPLEMEYSFYQAVCSGDLAYVQKNCRENAFTNLDGVGILSANPLTNMKYHFVVTVALITRRCVEAGMELEQAFRLSDFYILKMDTCPTIDDISKLHKKMALDYTRKMILVKKQSVLSKPVVLCMDYIYSHINKRISVDELARHVNLSQGYLSRLFKKELNISISDYICEMKIGKAQNLLKYSDYSLVEISNYLAFSSQSHFIQTFRKLVGMTPKKYRDHYYRTSW